MDDARARLRRAVTDALTECAGVPWRFDRCAIFAADVLRGVLGYDPAAEWRGRYTTERGMRRILGTRGLAGAVAAAARRHGWKPIDPLSAKAGDVGLVETRRGLAVALRHGRFFVGPVDRGFSAYEGVLVRRAWSVIRACPGEVGTGSATRTGAQE